MKNEQQIGKKYFQITFLTKKLTSRIYKEHTKLNNNKTTQLSQMTKIFEQKFHQRKNRDGKYEYEKMIMITDH